ncbi:MAG TPA: choice-of-anchor tandem repeat GloVer-containing protein [Candidatus Sulfotelmatobacter sp.]|jgi:uncharacterized repeat protein (TIGR03803 family)|nr:choice-of-anchor tandem repeat GloVer-containing protein [Candidatus Sulfotelmatobacter sp.]
MRSSKSPLAFDRISFIVLAVLLNIGTAFATTEKVVYSFQGTPDGDIPAATLVADSAGNLYGITNVGGSGQGTVFELSPPATAGGSWTEQILYAFQNDSHDGVFPNGTLTFDKQGNLYGTTTQGGNGVGAVFELSPPATSGGAWTETVLWSFPQQGLTGIYPSGKLEIDAAGNLYGTTQFGGVPKGGCSCGVVFELVKPKTSGGSWNERVLHNFGSITGDGTYPRSDLLLRGGMLYGTAEAGGAGSGAVFQLAPHTGLWTETILHSFTIGEGRAPRGRLIADPAGNLFGTLSTELGCCGAIFELSPPAIAGGSWQETTLYAFTGHSDGATPEGPLWRDSLGDLFGTTTADGRRPNGLGTVFKLKAPAVSGGTWTFVLLHDFGALSADDAASPEGGLVLQNGLLYGVARGGSDGLGAVYSVVP